jgi:hypothetical protein
VATIFVARSKTLSQWGYDVGLSKNIYKIGLTDGPVKDAIAKGWAGETDWVLVKKQEGVEGESEDAIIERLGRKERLIESRLYPRIRDAPGLFKVAPAHVENHLLVSRALADEPEIREIKIKHPDIAAYMIANALSSSGSL